MERQIKATVRPPKKPKLYLTTKIFDLSDRRLSIAIGDAQYKDIDQARGTILKDFSDNECRDGVCYMYPEIDNRECIEIPIFERGYTARQDEYQFSYFITKVY